ncbi:transposase [Paenibacillus montanisoli]|uniref:Transposase n=1 Tax=Paenibacillus montanisoli TaxID=2081970 RepID=A0A328U029_9BACL|nr:transposase [Paenibacillus montanisoli]RAP73336.1 transposase [Paenibacillus montanisoli]
MRGKLADQDKATIYQYQLIQKVLVRDELRKSHLTILAILSIFLLIMYRLDGIKALGIGITGALFIHFIITRLTLIRVDEPDDRRWGWRMMAPWFGYVPTAHIELGLYRRLHRHLLWLGLCAIGVFYPWANEPTMISLIMCHIWILAPRLVIMRKLRQAHRNGVLRIAGTDVSYYHR